MRIGIVNDLSLAVEALRRVVSAVDGFEIAWVAYNGKQAVEFTIKDRPDLILMDLIMPETDGFEASRIILGHNPNTQIIALSADNMPETRLRVEQSGMKELLAKPVTVEELRRVIDRYHKSEK